MECALGDGCGLTHSIYEWHAVLHTLFNKSGRLVALRGKKRGEESLSGVPTTPMADWSLDDAVRADAVSRLASNMIALAFARGAGLSEDAAAAAAAAAEKKAYTTARVEARTTTGVRPACETAAAYTRKLAALAIEVVEAAPTVGGEAGGADAGAAAGATTAAGDDDHDLDLHGDREFLVAESAEEHLASMLAEGAAHRKVNFFCLFSRSALAWSIGQRPKRSFEQPSPPLPCRTMTTAPRTRAPSALFSSLSHTHTPPPP
jgi:hypothetical protein